MSEPLEEYKAALINIIIWYRDEYHRQANGIHDDLITAVNRATTAEQLDDVECVLDDWFDGPPD